MKKLLEKVEWKWGGKLKTDYLEAMCKKPQHALYSSSTSPDLYAIYRYNLFQFNLL